MGKRGKPESRASVFGVPMFWPITIVGNHQVFFYHQKDFFFSAHVPAKNSDLGANVNKIKLYNNIIYIYVYICIYM